MQDLGVNEIYDILFNKTDYNPVVEDANDTLKKLVKNISEVNNIKSEFDWDDLDWVLKKSKHWFYNNAKQEKTQNINVDQFKEYLNSELPNFWRYKYIKNKHDKEKVKIQFIGKVDLDNKTQLSSNDRLALYIKSSLNDLSQMKFSCNKKTLNIYLKNKLKQWNNPPLHTQQILNWPHIGFILNLPDITIVHQATHKYSRYIRLDSCNEELKLEKCNSLINDNPLESSYYCNIEVITMYLCLCKQVISQISNISKRRKDELTILFATIIKSLVFCEIRTLPCNVDFNYLTTKYNLIREYDTTFEGININNEKTPNNVHKIIEVISPSFKINITRCEFNQQCKEETREKILTYFQDIFDKESGSFYENFVEVIKKNTPYFCSCCNITFYENSFYAMENHIHEVHGCEDILWKCMGCEDKFTTYELSTNNWRHICAETID